MLSVVRPPYLLKRFYSGFTWRIPTDKNEIFLTFDDGPTPEITEFVLDQLSAFNAKATFFCLGKNVVAHPHIFERIQNEQHSVANHTHNHKNGWITPTQEYCDDITIAQKYINSNLFRPPYGRIKKSQTEIINKQFKIIMWDVLSYDFNIKVSPEKCTDNVISNTRNGSIIVFHDSVKAANNLRYSLPRVLKYFAGKQYAFSKISTS